MRQEVASKLLKGDRNVSAKHPNVTILFSDIVGFTAISGGVKPGQVMVMLDQLYEGTQRRGKSHCGIPSYSLPLPFLLYCMHIATACNLLLQFERMTLGRTLAYHPSPVITCWG